MRPLHSNNTHNINRFSIDKAIVCETNLLIQKRLTQYIGNLLIPGALLILWRSLKDKCSRINKLVLRNLYFKSHPKLSFCGCCYCAVASLYLDESYYSVKRIVKCTTLSKKNTIYFK